MQFGLKKYVSVGIDHAVTDDGGKFMAHAVEFLQVFHELWQFFGAGMGNAFLDDIDGLDEQCVFPVVQSVWNQTE